jgi:hypothetical protein
MITQDLATQPNACQASRRKHHLLGFGHFIRLTGNELDAARRATGIPPACMKLIQLGHVREGENQSFPNRHIELAHSIDSQLWHDEPPVALILWMTKLNAASPYPIGRQIGLLVVLEIES